MSAPHVRHNEVHGGLEIAVLKSRNAQSSYVSKLDAMEEAAIMSTTYWNVKGGEVGCHA
jgi:hypothetical protein